MLAKVKLALRIASAVYDSELTLLIAAARKDLELCGAIKEYETEADIPDLVQLAIITYCRLHFGQPEDYDRLALSYNEQKAQLQMSHIYNDRGWDEE